MTDGLTRRQLLRRAAAGSAFLTVPGVLAACGGSSKTAATTSGAKQDARQDAPVLQLDALHGHEQQDAQHPSLIEFEKKYGVHVAYTDGHQRQRLVLREDPRRALAWPIDRP